MTGSSATPGNDTLVEFERSPPRPMGRGCVWWRAASPGSRPARSAGRPNYEDNVGGWRQVVGQLADYAARVAA